VLCDSPLGIYSGTWNRDGVILFSGSSRTIQRASAAGGVPAQVLALDESRKENSQRIPQFLPDGRRFLYASALWRIAISVSAEPQRLSIGENGILPAISKQGN
jgi:hypothetical protein